MLLCSSNKAPHLCALAQVWSVLTGYNTLADFVPNLDICERVSGAPPGKQRLRQRACSQSLYWRLQAEAILDVQKVVRTQDRRELHFTMVEGDFQVEHPRPSRHRIYHFSLITLMSLAGTESNVSGQG